MLHLLGTDEAGYGPNLGPLCVAISAWQTPGSLEEPEMCLYQRLSDVVCADGRAPNKLSIADSKALYKAGGSLAGLERGVLAALAALDRCPASWREAWSLLDEAAPPQIEALPWHDGFDEPLPLHADRVAPRDDAAALVRGCEAAGVKLVELRASVLFPPAFNQAVLDCGNKADVLSFTTLLLAHRVIERLPPGPALVLCDKHGGRSRYAALLQHAFLADGVRVRYESKTLSEYAFAVGARRVVFRFQPRGERQLPTALASMTAKYLRELAMRPFNAYWTRLIPGLRPTAGYPVDARRFWRDTELVRQRQGIDADLLWRRR